MPIHFLPVWNPTGASAPLVLLFPPWPNLLLFPLYLLDRLLLSGHPCHKPGIVCFPGSVNVPPTLINHWILSCSCWFPLESGCSGTFPLVGCSWLPAVWPTCIPPAIPNTGCHNSGLLRLFPRVCLAFPGLQFGPLPDLEVHHRIGIIGQHLPIPPWM